MSADPSQQVSSNVPSASLAVLGAGQLLTLAGPRRARFGPELLELGIIAPGGFLVENGVIALVGPSSEIERRVSASTRVLECDGRVVLPGFVDAHTHLVFAGNRLEDFEKRISGESYTEIAKEGGGIASTVRSTRAASDEELLSRAKAHARWMLSCGTTTAECKSGYGLSTEDELRILRTIRRLGDESALKCVPTFLGAHAVAVEFAGRTEEYVSYVVGEMLPAVAAEGLAEFCDAFCEAGYFSVDQCRRVLEAGRQLGWGVRIHADQLELGGGAELAGYVGAVTADHLECTDAEGIAALKRGSVQPVLLPGSVYGLGLERYPDMRGMIRAGLAPVLATDFNPGSSPTPSIPMILSLACTKMGILPAEAIVSATINAAYSLNRGERVGSIEPGKEADFVLFDCDDYREIPYFFGRNAVAQVFLDGCAV